MFFFEINPLKHILVHTNKYELFLEFKHYFI